MSCPTGLDLAGHSGQSAQRPPPGGSRRASGWQSPEIGENARSSPRRSLIMRSDRSSGEDVDVDARARTASADFTRTVPYGSSCPTDAQGNACAPDGRSFLTNTSCVLAGPPLGLHRGTRAVARRPLPACRPWRQFRRQCLEAPNRHEHVSRRHDIDRRADLRWLTAVRISRFRLTCTRAMLALSPKLEVPRLSL